MTKTSDTPTPITAEASFMIGSPRAEQLGPECVVVVNTISSRLERDRGELLEALQFLLAVSWGSDSDKQGAEKRAEAAIARMKETI